MKVILLLVCLVLVSFQTNDSSWNHLKALFSIIMKGGGMFHPSRDEMTFVSNEKGVAQIYKQKFDPIKGKLVGEAKSIITTKDRVTYPSYLDDGSLLFLHDRGGSENFQIGFLDLTDKVTWVTENYKASHEYNYVSDKYLYYVSNEKSKIMQVFRRSLPLNQKGKTELIYSPSVPSVAGVSIVSKDDSKIFIEQSYSNLYSEILLKDLKLNKIISLTKPIAGNTRRRWSPIHFLDQKQTRMLVKSDFESDFNRLIIIEWKDGDFTKPGKLIKIPFFEKIKWDVKSIERVKKTNTFFISLNQNGYSKLYKIKFSSKGQIKEKEVIELPLKNSNIEQGGYRSYSSSLSINRNGKYLAMTLTNSITPTNLYLLNLKTKKSKRLFKNPIPESLKNMKFVQEKLRHFQSWDFTEIPYYLYKPNTKKPLNGFPTILILHGGPEAQSRPEFSPLTQFFLNSGFAVVEPNIRGSNGYGRKFLDMDNREKRMDAIKDIKEMAKELKNYNFIDTKRLVVLGGSYGGYATLMSIVTYPKLWKAGVDIVGMSNLVTFLEHTAKWRRVLREPEYGYLKTQRKMLEKISPINYVQNARAPVYIIQGANDPRVPASEAVQMFNKLKKMKNGNVSKSKLLLLKDEGHGFSKRKNRLLVYHSLIQWLKEIV